MKYILSADTLRCRQSLPLEVKVVMTRNRVRSFINEYGTEGVYISFSGGKDSTILMDIVRREDRRIPAVFVDTWMDTRVSGSLSGGRKISQCSNL